MPRDRRLTDRARRLPRPFFSRHTARLCRIGDPLLCRRPGFGPRVTRLIRHDVSDASALEAELTRLTAGRKPASFLPILVNACADASARWATRVALPATTVPHANRRNHRG